MAPGEDLPSPPDPLLAAWSRVEERWEDPDAHRAFVGLASALERLAEAGSLYRESAANPARRPVAEAQIAAIVNVAVARMKDSFGPPADPRERYRLLRFVAWVLSLTLMMLVLLAYRMNR